MCTWPAVRCTSTGRACRRAMAPCCAIRPRLCWTVRATRRCWYSTCRTPDNVPAMMRTIQILVLLLVVIAAVGLAAKRLKIPAAILLVLAGLVPGLLPGLAEGRVAPRILLLLVVAPVHLFFPGGPWLRGD